MLSSARTALQMWLYCDNSLNLKCIEWERAHANYEMFIQSLLNEKKNQTQKGY